jgi:hypothetical protein
LACQVKKKGKEMQRRVNRCGHLKTGWIGSHRTIEANVGVNGIDR